MRPPPPCCRKVLVRDVLFSVGATASPPTYLTMLVMDYCDRGSLGNAIHRVRGRMGLRVRFRVGGSWTTATEGPLGTPYTGCEAAWG